MRAYLNVTVAEVPGLHCRDTAADVRAYAPGCRHAENLARAVEKLGKAADNGKRGADAWPYVTACNVAACSCFWPYADRVRLIEQPLDVVRRMLGLPTAGTLGVLALSR